MNTSLIITGGFIQHQDKTKAAIENERLAALLSCLYNTSALDTSNGDEIIFAEYGEKSRLKNIVEMKLRHVNFKYVFVEGKGFNQSIIKNAGASAASNEIVCWINSDVIVQKNIFNILRSRFEKNPNIFATAARHDVFNEGRMWYNESAGGGGSGGSIKLIVGMYNFVDDINDNSAYTLVSTSIDDAGWHHALNTPRVPIQTNIKVFAHPAYKHRIIHDFMQGYINYGELIAVTKDIWKKYPFDEEITAIVDSYIRDIIFGNEKDFKLELIHDETAIFHLSGSDYMQQEVQDSDKYKRLIEDIIKAAKKYPCMHHWLVFSYFKEFDSAIKELNIPFKKILETWRTPLMWRYYRNKERVKELYEVTDFAIL